MSSSGAGLSNSSCGSSVQAHQPRQESLHEQGNPTMMSNYSRMMAMERESSVPSLRSLLHRAHSHPATTLPCLTSSSSRFLDVLSHSSSSAFSFNTTDSFGATDSSTSGIIRHVLDRALALTEPPAEESDMSSILNVEEEGEGNNQGSADDTRRNSHRRRRTKGLCSSRKHRRRNQDRSIQ